MLPTIAARGDVVLVDKISLRWRPIESGEVVTCDPPSGGRSAVCKRVVGTAGSKVLIAGHRQALTVPPGHVWLAGDNASNSSDSRFYGPVPLGLLRGRVRGRVWPPHRLGPLPTPLHGSDRPKGDRDERYRPKTAQEAVKDLWMPVPVDRTQAPRFARPKLAQPDKSNGDKHA